MIKLIMQVSGMSSRLFHYIVFMPDNTQITNSKLAGFGILSAFNEEI